MFDFIIFAASGVSALFVPFVVGLGGAVLPVMVGAAFIRHKTKAETANLLTEAAARLIVAYEHRIADLETRLDKSEHDEKACMRKLAELEHKLELLTSEKKFQSPRDDHEEL